MIFIFAGFNSLLYFWLHFFVAFAVILFVHRNVFAFEDYLNTALRLALVSLDSTVLIFTFAGFNLLLIAVVAFFPKAAAKGSFKKSAVIKHCYQTLPKVLLK